MNTISFEELMRQAGMTTADYMKDAVRYIDQQFGEGYAAEHPELIAAFISSCATDFQSGVIATRVVPALEGIGYTLGQRLE